MEIRSLRGIAHFDESTKRGKAVEERALEVVPRELNIHHLIIHDGGGGHLEVDVELESHFSLSGGLGVR